MTQFNKAEEKITFQQNQEVRKQISLFLDADTFFLKTNNKTKKRQPEHRFYRSYRALVSIKKVKLTFSNVNKSVTTSEWHKNERN